MNWKCAKKEFDLISKIADRTMGIVVRAQAEYTKQHVLMDLTATHANGCPLDLDGLLVASDGDFAHDVFGIRRHINRQTGKLEDFFIPRYAKRCS